MHSKKVTGVNIKVEFNYVTTFAQPATQRALFSIDFNYAKRFLVYYVIAIFLDHVTAR